MLILSRKKNQSIIINDNIEIVIIEVTPEQVKLGFKAPKDVGIHRSEIYKKIKQEMFQAAKSDPKSLSTFTEKPPKRPAQP